ncbi:MAG: hypothetical protein IJC49_05450 [Clostridia bacterium]|nr:hypothetical protein [Clostridia bacterium]
MGLFTNFRREKPPKDTESVQFKRWMANKLNEKHIRYVLERENNEERIIGRDGFISVVENDLVVIADGTEKFRTPIDTMSAWEFMSLQGVTITGFDKLTERERTVLAYYIYHR